MLKRPLNADINADKMMREARSGAAPIAVRGGQYEGVEKLLALTVRERGGPLGSAILIEVPKRSLSLVV